MRPVRAQRVLAAVPGVAAATAGVAAEGRGAVRGLDCEVIDVGFISDVQEGAVAAEKLRRADCGSSVS